ncbi:histidine phosphatase family protein [Lipingzhangella sp. LS1_29]|uniref:Histidine phosphatase family protein n=1 Tax=Lipingzhangella rawalii TaxID=2055835 RepID=A0ABU2HC57_9ACTN|nr:histidine phosphatase family protein [Lipingzhangella rawalii]MDS1272582.1 histidine phosphatase family protein [Lipingzhangella rawalii]
MPDPVRIRRVVCWRHGQTQWNAERRFQGHTDIPLNDIGLRQAEQAAELLAALEPDAILSSDLSRATATAAALARRTGQTVTLDKGLRERAGGVWEGLTRGEIMRRWPDEYERWEIPEGEDLETVGSRITDVVRRAVTELPDRATLVIVSHGAALRAGITQLLGLPPQSLRMLGPLGNCSWSVLEPRPEGHWCLVEHNAATLPEVRVLSDDQ